jgi:hypothetical protein
MTLRTIKHINKMTAPIPHTIWGTMPNSRKFSPESRNNQNKIPPDTTAKNIGIIGTSII